MGEQSRKAFAEQQARDAAEREAMIQMNLKKIAEDEATPPPSPTINEIREAMGLKSVPSSEEIQAVKKSDEDDKKSDDDKKTDDDKKVADDTVNKTSTAADQKGGQYKTRDMNAKK